jgi:hypothetical protein
MNDVEALLPGGVGVVRSSLGRIRRGWADVVAVTAILVIPLQLAIAYAERAGAPIGVEADVAAGFSGVRATVAAVLHLVDFFIVTPLVLGVALLVLSGVAAGRDGLLARAFRYRYRLLATVVLATLAALLPMVPGVLLFAAGLPARLSGSAPDPGTLVPGVVLLLVGLAVAAFIGLGFTVAPALVTLEDGGIGASLRGSWRRMRGLRWPAFGVTVVLLLAVGFPSMLLYGAVQLLTLGRGPLLWSLEGLASGVFSLAATLVSAAIGAEFWARTRPLERPVDPDAT